MPAKPDLALLGHLRLAVDHSALNLHGAAYCVDHAGELRQETVADVLHGTATVLGDLRLDQLAEMRLQAFVRALLILAHQPRVAGHISGENRGKAAGLAHNVSLAASRRPDR